MKKTIVTLFTAAVTALSLGAWAADVVKVGAEVKVPVEMVVPTTITQVVVFDVDNTYVMATEQKVENWVMVTPEMAKTAQVVSLMKNQFPEITSVSQAANNGESKASATPFAKTGLMEPVAINHTVVNTVYYKFNGQVYSFETKDAVGETITVSQKLLDVSKKV